MGGSAWKLEAKGNTFAEIQYYVDSYTQRAI